MRKSSDTTRVRGFVWLISDVLPYGSRSSSDFRKLHSLVLRSRDCACSGGSFHKTDRLAISLLQQDTGVHSSARQLSSFRKFRQSCAAMSAYLSSSLHTSLRWERGCLYRHCKRLRGSLHSMTSRVVSWLTKAWDFAKSDPSKVIHSLKMGSALLLGFLLVLLDAPYEKLGSHAVWAAVTVIVVFESSVGASLSKGCNRGAGTLLAGLLAVGIGQIASLSGGVGHPIMIGLSVFIIGGFVTFAKLLPTLKPYQSSCPTFLVTFSLIIVAEYRGGNPVSTAANRFLIILLGAILGLAVNVFVLPCWAGNDLHRNIAKNFENVADSLEECVDHYLEGISLERLPSKILMGLAADDPVYRGYRSALISASKEESLASFACWEPPHGKFLMFKYPWKAYVKVGAVLRHSTYSVVALHGCLRASIQAPLAVRAMFESELREVSSEGAQVLRKLGKQVKNMQKADYTTILNGVHSAVEQLQQSLYLHSYLLVRQETGILEDHVQNLSVNVIPEVSRHVNFEKLVPTGSSDRLEMADSQEESNNMSGRCVKKLHSWPSRPMDDLDFDKDFVFAQSVKVLESAGALSLGTFATLLIEVALGLDYVVDAVEELSDLAKFKDAKENSDTKV